jgi:glycosyltransferase involved in cell wall biosynthesis
MNDKKKLLILTRWFSPGIKAGGLIQACGGIAINLANDYDVYVLTTNRDFDTNHPYPNIPTDQWLHKDGFNLMYLSSKTSTRKRLTEIILESKPNYIYLSGLYDGLFNVYPLLLKWRNKIKALLILAPSGMLMESAMAHKTLKKRLFIFSFKLLGFHKSLIFHATDQLETDSILKYFGSNTTIQNISLFPPKIALHNNKIEKQKGSLSMVYISRIHPVKKNLAYLLNCLKEVESNVSLSIVGPIEDPDYWVNCQDIIAGLPNNVSADYLGVINNAAVIGFIQQHHLFCLPTTGENYGYVIIEALAAGRPVLISDQTPWKNLSQHSAGWDLPLDDPEAYITTIEKVAAMDQGEFNPLCENALNYAKQSIDPKELVNAYREMLDSN